MMLNSIRSEWIKFRSVRSTLLLLGAGGALTVLFAVLIARDLARDQQTFHLTDISAGSNIAVYLFGALGVQIIGQEYRFNTIRSTFLATPKRLRVYLAKMIVVSAAVAAMALLTQLISFFIGHAMLESLHLDGVDRRAIFGTALFAVGWTLAGLALGAILRQPIAGIIILLVEGAVVETIIASQVDWTVPWLPYLNGSQMAMRGGQLEPADAFYGLRSPLEGGLYFFAVVAVLLVIGAVLVQRRDA